MALPRVIILACLNMTALALAQNAPQAEMGSAIIVNEDVLDSTADIAIATTAMPDLGSLSIEPPSSNQTDAVGTGSTSGVEPTNAPKELQVDEPEETTHSIANSTMITATKDEGTNTSATEDIEAPATTVPDLLASGVSFRDPGFIALSVLTALMLFMMIFV